jgi:hypothetical protein
MFYLGAGNGLTLFVQDMAFQCGKVTSLCAKGGGRKNENGEHAKCCECVF